MSVLSTTEVEARMETGLDTADLQALIDEEEAWLAGDPRVGIGQLVGERTQSIWVTPGDDRPLLLQRPTDETGGYGSGGSLIVIDGGTLLGEADVALTGPARLEKVSGAWTGPRVLVTSIPTDEASVRRALFELIRISITASPYNQEATGGGGGGGGGGHSYSRARSPQSLREEIARSLHPHRGHMTTRMGSGTGPERITSR